MICSSFCDAVSRFVSRRTCSSVSGVQVLRLVDDHDDAAALGVRFQQPLVQEVDQVLDAGRVLVAHEDAELFADRQDELNRR